MLFNMLKSITSFQYESFLLLILVLFVSLAAISFFMIRKVKREHLKKIDEIKETRDFLNRIMMSMQEGILVLDKDYRVVMVNDYLLKLTRLSRQEIKGMLCYVAFHGLEK